jgi:hypothetical protein
MPRRIVLDLACQIWFGTVVVVLVIVLRAMLGAVHALPHFSNAEAKRLSAKCGGVIFRLCLFLCPWIQFGAVKGKTGRNLSEILAGGDQGCKDGGGTMVLMNHTSFLDSLLASAILTAYGRQNPSLKF